MIRLTVMYPATPGSSFDWSHYLGPHLALARQLLSPFGLLRIEIDRGVAGFPPGTPLHFHAIGHLFFSSAGELERAMAATAPQLLADQRKYFSGESVVQVNEVVGTQAPAERRGGASD
ncbi:MAG TPA: EthD family reductase [Terriglobales bacterium]|nr:EthD family reductase [Terriglobales bacterium]